MTTEWYEVQKRGGRWRAIRLDARSAVLRIDQGCEVLLADQGVLASLARRVDADVTIIRPFECELPAYFHRYGYAPPVALAY